MKTRFVFALIGALGVSGPVAAQAPVRADAAPAPDAKAQMLCRMARWQWHLKQPDQPLPAFDSTSIEGFRKSAFSTDKATKRAAGIGVLYDSVQARLTARNLTYGKATTTDLGAAIGAVLTRQYRGKAEASQAAAFAATFPTSAATATDVTSKAAAEGGDSTTDAAAAVPASPKSPVPEPVADEARSASPAPASPTVPFGLGLLTGLLVGAAGCYWLSARHQQDVRNREKVAALEKEQRAERRKTRDQYISSLEHKLLNLELGAEQTPATHRQSPKPAPPKAPPSAPQVPPSPAPHSALMVEPVESADPEPGRTIELSVAPAPVAVPACFYAPAPDVPYVEHRKLSAEPFDLMPIRLQLTEGSDGTRATYGFSPEADQGRIIADGVRNLRAFFDFELPPTEQFTSIGTRQPGRLERVGERWEVREKAQLEIR